MFFLIFLFFSLFFFFFFVFFPFCFFFSLIFSFFFLLIFFIMFFFSFSSLFLFLFFFSVCLFSLFSCVFSFLFLFYKKMFVFLEKIKISTLGFLTLEMVKGGITRGAFTQKVAATGHPHNLSNSRRHRNVDDLLHGALLNLLLWNVLGLCDLRGVQHYLNHRNLSLHSKRSVDDLVQDLYFLR